MSERPTPETDAAIQASNGQWSCVLRDACKRLERERDEAREHWKEQNEALRSIVEHGESEIQRLTKEKDEAIEARKVSAADWLSQVQNADLRVKHALEIAAKAVKEFDEANCKLADALQEVHLRTLDYERMKQQRDEARELLEAAQNALDAIHLEVGSWITKLKSK